MHFCNKRKKGGAGDVRSSSAIFAMEKEMDRDENMNQQTEEETGEQTDFDYWANERLKNGLVGSVLGFLIGTWSLVTSAVGIAFRNIFFGSREPFNWGKLVSDAYNRQRITEEGKNIKKKNREELKQENKEGKPKAA